MMKTKIRSYLLIADLSNIIMVAAFNLSVLMLIKMVQRSDIKLAEVAGVLFVILFSEFLRKKVSNFYLFSFLHFVMFVADIFIPMLLESKFVLFGYILAFTILNYRCLIEKRDGLAYIHIAFVVFPVGGYLFSDVFHFPQRMTYFFIMGIVFFAFFYLRLFFNNAFLLAASKIQDDKMPYSDMISNDSKLVFPFVFGSILVMILAKIESLDEISLKIYMAFIWLLKNVIFGIFWVYNFIYELFLKDTMVDMPQIQMLEEMEEESLLSSTIYNVLTFIFYILAIAVIIFAVVKFILWLIKSFRNKESIKTLTIEDSEMVEIRERIVRKKNKNKVKLSKIRKIYKKSIEKKAKEGYEVVKSHTPKERAEDLMKSRNFDINELTLMYEKERYQKEI